MQLPLSKPSSLETQMQYLQKIEYHIYLIITYTNKKGNCYMLNAEHIYYENKLRCFTTIVSLEKSHNWTHVKLQFYNLTVMILIMQCLISALTWYFVVWSKQLWIFLGSFWQYLEIFRKFSEMGPGLVFFLCSVVRTVRILYHKSKITRMLGDMTFLLNKWISLLCCAQSRNIFQHSKRNFVSLCSYVISSMNGL